MNITLPIALAGMLAGTIIAVADNPPKFDVAPGCKEAAALNQNMDLSVSQDYKSCMADEESAQAELDKNWATYATADKQRCIGQIDAGGMPSYVEVLECLLVTVGVGNPVPPVGGAGMGEGSKRQLVGVKKAKMQKNQQKAQ